MMFRRVSSSESPLPKTKPLSSAPLGSPASPPPSLAISSSLPSQTNEQLPQEAIRRRQSSMSFRNTLLNMKGYMNSTRLMVLSVLCLQNSMFTTLRRYSQGVLKETYSKVRNSCRQLRIDQLNILQHNQLTNQSKLMFATFVIFSTNSCCWQKSSK